MAVDIAVLGLEVRSDGVVVASDRLKQLTAEGGKAEQATDKLSTSFQNATKYIQAAVAAMAAWKLTEYAKEATLLAARVETLGVVMGVVGNNAGYTSRQMQEYDKAVQKMGITTQESRANLIKMAGSQMELAKATQLARVAQDAAVIGNINSSEAFGRMIQGIRSGETEILKNIGINVQFEQAYKKAAATLGKTSEQMTGAEKVTARMNAVLDYGKNIAGAYEASMGTAGKQLNSMSRYTEELRLKFGETFTPALSFVVVELTNALKDADTMLGKNKSTVDEWGQNFKSVVVSIAAEITRLSMLIDKAGGSMTSAAMLIFAPGAAMGNENSKKQFERFAQANMDYEARYKAGEDRLTRLAMSEMNPGTTGRTSAQEQASIDAASQRKAKEAAEAAAEAAKKGAEAAKKWASTYEQLRKEIDLLNPSMTELDRKILDVTQKYADLERKKGANIEKLRQLKAEHVEAIRTQYEIAEAIKATSKEFQEYLRIAGEDTAISQTADAIDEQHRAFRESIRTMDSAAKAAKDVSDAVYDINRAFDEAGKSGAIEAYINNLFRLKELQNSTADTTISMISDPYEQQTAIIEARYQREIELIGEKMNALREAGLQESAIYQALTEDVLTKAQKRDKDLLDNQLKQSKAGWDGVVAQAQKAFPKLTGLDKALNAVFKDHTKMRLSTEEERAKGAEKLVKDETRSNLSMYGAYAGAAGAMFEGLAATQDQTSRSGFETAKAFNIAAAVMSTAAAIMNAMASVPYPMNIAAAVTTGVMGAIQIANIASTTFGGGAKAPTASLSAGSFGGAGGSSASSTVGSMIGSPIKYGADAVGSESMEKLAKSAENASLAVGDLTSAFLKATNAFESGNIGEQIISRMIGLGSGQIKADLPEGKDDIGYDRQLLKMWDALINDSIETLKKGAAALGIATPGYASTTYYGGKINGSSREQATDFFEADYRQSMDDFAKMIPGLEEYAKIGEDASKSLERLTTALYDTNKQFQLMGVTLLDGIAGANIASKLEDAFTEKGEDFYDALDSYFTNLFSDQEQKAAKELDARKTINSEWKKINELLPQQFKVVVDNITGIATVDMASATREIPKTREEFRALVNSLDLTTEQGASAFASLMSISEAFGTMMTAADEAAEKLREIQQGMEDLDVRYMKATGKGAEADALSRQLAGQREIEQAVADNMGDAYLTRLREVLALEEQAATQNVQDMSQILAQRQSLQDQLDIVEGRRTQREIDLAKITDEVSQSLQERIWTLQDEKAVISQRQALQNQLDVLTGTRTQREIDLAKITDATSRSLQQRIYSLQDEATAVAAATAAAEKARQAAEALASARYDMTLKLLQAEGRTAEATAMQRQRELNAMQSSLRPLQQRIWLLEDEKAKLESLKTAANDAFSALSDSISAAKDARQKEYDTQADMLSKSLDATKSMYQSVVQAGEQAINQLQAFADRVRGVMGNLATQGVDAATSRALARSQVAAVIARGKVPINGELDNALNILGNLNASDYASYADFAAEKAATISQLSSLAKLTNKQISVEQQAYDLQQRQIAISINQIEEQQAAAKSALEADNIRFDQTIDYYKQQIDAMNGTTKAVLSVEAAVLGMTSALAAYQSQSASYALLVAQSPIAKLPGFAVGVDYVPYDMVAQIHQGERIIPAADNYKIMQSNDELIEEVRMLRAEVRAVVGNTGKSARILERVTPEGDAIETRVAA